MRRRSGRVAVGAVLFVLGFLVVVQLRSQSADQGLNALSVQDLTELVANLTTRNNQLRDEIGTLEQQRDAIAGARRARRLVGGPGARRPQPGARLVGRDRPSSAPGSGSRSSGPIPGDALEQLLNELRNAGAEAISVGDRRVVQGDVPNGPSGSVMVGDELARGPRSSSSRSASRRRSRGR